MVEEIRFIGTISKKDDGRYYIQIPAEVLKRPEIAEAVKRFAEKKTRLIVELKVLHGEIVRKG